MTSDNPFNDALHREYDRRPIPDPTALTTEGMARLESASRTLILSEVAHLAALFTEKFEGIDQRFVDLEKRMAEQKQDTKNALDAALAAQKEQVRDQTIASEKSVSKSELATTERIKSAEASMATTSKATDDKINDLKERVVKIESIKLGITEAGVAVRAKIDSSWGIAIGLAIVLVPIFIFLASHFH